MTLTKFGLPDWRDQDPKARPSYDLVQDAKAAIRVWFEQNKGLEEGW